MQLNYLNDLNFQQIYLSPNGKKRLKRTQKFLPSQRSGFDGDAKNRLGKVPKGIKISQVYFYTTDNQNKKKGSWEVVKCEEPPLAHFIFGIFESAQVVVAYSFSQ